MRLWLYCLISLLLSHTVSLHLVNTLIYDEQSYLSAVRDINSKLRTDVERIKTDLQALKQQLRKTEGNDSAKIKLLRNALSVEKDDLLRLESYTQLPYNQKACRCKGFTPDLKSLVSSNLEISLNSIRRLKDNMLSWPNCRLVNELKSQVLREQQYIANLKSIANSDCHRPPKQFLPDQATGLINLNESRYISNLEGTKWIYGSISAIDYKYRMFSLSSKTNLTKCPEDKPFTKTGKECISCPENNPIWSIGDSICTTCGMGQHYNPHGHNCSSGNVQEEQSLAKIKGIGLYGTETKTYATGFNRNKRGVNYINSPPFNDPDMKSCPLDKPFFDGKQCVQCQLPRVFNYNTLNCESCPLGTYFNIKRKVCSYGSQKKLVTNLNSQNLIIGTDKTLQQYKSQQDQKVSEDQQLKVCPIEQPYFDGEECVSCGGAKPYFNLQSSECQNCSPGFSYFQAVNNCTVNIYITNSLSKRLIQSDANTIESIFKEASNLRSNNPYNRLQICPINKPFSRSFSCIQCPQQNPLFELSTQLCTKCPDQTVYDSQMSRCIGKYITNPEAPNINFKGISKQEYSEYYDHIKSKYPNIRDCPHQAPYFEGVRCVSCALSTPIFSLKTKMCGQCPIGKVFSQEKGLCLDE